MATPPPPIPITTQPNLTATTTLLSFFTRLTSSLSQSFSNHRPWLELIDRTTISRPDSFSDATSRIRKNFSYFRINYAAILSIIIAISLFTHPLSLITLLILLASWIFLYLFRPADQPVIIMGRVFSSRETLVLLVFLTVVVFLTNVGTVMILALLVGLGVLCVHGAFKVPEDLFLDEQEPVYNGGFLSFLGGAASNAVGPTVPRV